MWLCCKNRQMNAVLLTVVFLGLSLASGNDFNIFVRPKVGFDIADSAYSVAFDPFDGSLLVYGQFHDPDASAEVYIVRVFTNGTQKLLDSYGTPGMDYCGNPSATNTIEVGCPIIIDPQTREIFVHGISQNFSGQNDQYSAFALRVSSNGTRLWAITYGPGGRTFVYGMSIALASPYLLLAGIKRGDFNGQPSIGGKRLEDNYLIKVHICNGSNVWTDIWGSVNQDFLYAISADVTAGIVYSTGISGGDVSLDDLDFFIDRHFISNGTRLPDPIYTGSAGDDVALGIAIDTKTKLLYVCGNAAGPVNDVLLMSDPYDQIIMAVHTENFSIAWTRIIGSNSEDDYASSISIHPQSGNVYVSGRVSGELPGDYNQTYYGYDDLSLAVFTPNGALLRFITIGTGYSDASLGSCFNSNGTLYIAGVYNNAAAICAYAKDSFKETPASTNVALTTGIVSSTATVNISITAINNTTTATTSLLSLNTTTTTTAKPASHSLPSNSLPQAIASTFSLIVVAISATALSLLFVYLVAVRLIARKRTLLSTAQKRQVVKPRGKLSSAPAFNRSYQVVNMQTVITADTELAVPQSIKEYIQFLPRVSTEQATLIKSQQSTHFTTVAPTTISTRKALFIPGHLMAAKSAVFPLQVIFSSSNCEVSCCTPLDMELRRRCGNRMLVVKYLKKVNSMAIDAFNQEISIMHYFQGRPNFVQLLGFCTEPPAIITELYSMGNLMDCMYTKRLIVSTLSEMHSNGFSHSDLKPQNVFVDKRDGEYCCFLGDFGLARVLDDTHLAVKAYKALNTKGLTIYYAAPEIFMWFRNRISTQTTELSAEYFLKADIYSLAVIFYELAINDFVWK